MSMPMAPPDTRAAGQAGHITDHNTISDALDWLGDAVGALQAQSAGSLLLSPVAVQSASFPAAGGIFYPVNVSSGPVTATLPAAAADGTRIGFKVVRAAPQAQYALTVSASGSDLFDIAAGKSSAGLLMPGQAMTVQYSAGSGLWYVISSGVALSSPWEASDSGLLYQSSDLDACSGTTSMTSGVLYLSRVNIRQPCTVTSLSWSQGNSASGVVSGQNYIGLYSSAGALLGSASTDSSITSQGPHSLAMTGGPVAAGAGYAWRALLANAGTTPALTRGNPAPVNFGLTAAQYRFAVNGSGLTALPGSITPSSNSGTGAISAWAGVS